jgi:hypothetical protein
LLIQIDMEFKAYPVDSDGHLQPPKVIAADTDAGAIGQVKKMLNGLPIELWQGVRLVGWFERTEDGVIAELAPDRVPATSDSSASRSTDRA